MLLALQATQVDFMSTLKVVGIVMLWIIASASSLEKIWLWFTGGSKTKEEILKRRLEAIEAAAGQVVDKDALEKRQTTAEDKHKLLAVDVLNMHNMLHEYERERDRLKGEIMGQLKDFRKDLIPLEPIPSRVSSLEAKFDNLKDEIGRLRDGQQELKSDIKANKVELREDMRGNKSEILEAISKLNH